MGSWIRLYALFGQSTVPPDAAEVIEQAVKKAIKRGDVSPNAAWQLIEFWAADALAAYDAEDFAATREKSAEDSDGLRFWSKVRQDMVSEYAPHLGACWIWAAGRFQTGYGNFYLDGGVHYAHRVAYEIEVGPIPEDFEIDHLCRVRPCVRPSHLEAVTKQENIRRAALMRTHCPSGHPYEGDNLTTKTDGSRRCKECHRQQERDRYRRRTRKITRRSTE